MQLYKAAYGIMIIVIIEDLRKDRFGSANLVPHFENTCNTHRIPSNVTFHSATAEVSILRVY